MSPLSNKQKIEKIAAEANYSIPVQGKEIPLVRKRVPLELFQLDPTNQRIQYLLKSKNINPTDENISKLMWDEDYVKNLGHSIEMNGGLMTPLLVTSEGIVVEGNSRLVALREVKKRIEAKVDGGDGNVDPGILMPPCEILPDNINRTDLLWLLAEVHIAGKHPWDPYEQAESIYALRFHEKQSLDKIAQHLRMRRTTVQAKLDAYSLMTEYLQKHTGKGQITKWSYFEELYKKKPLVDRLNNEPGFKDELFTLISEERLKGENIRQLEEVLKVPEAKKVLKTQNFKEAFKKLIELKPSQGSTVFKTITTLIDQLETLPQSELNELQNADSDDERIQLLNKLSQGLVGLSSLIGLNLVMEDEVASAKS